MLRALIATTEHLSRAEVDEIVVALSGPRRLAMVVALERLASAGVEGAPLAEGLLTTARQLK